MPKVMAKEVEVELSLDDLLAAIRQLEPEEQEIVRRELELRPWSQRLDDLLARIWARVEQHPISEEEVNAEVEAARAALYAQSGD